MTSKLLNSAFIAVCLLVFATHTKSAPLATSAGTAPFVIGTTKSETNFAGAWERLVYAELFSRLGLGITFVKLPLPRLNVELQQGNIDAEMPRTLADGAAYPDLIRVDEPVFIFAWGIYTANPKLQADKLEALPSYLNVEYRRDNVACENALKSIVPADQLSHIVLPIQGLRKLASGRTDIYCDVDMAVLNELFQSKTDDFSAVRKLFDLENAMPLYLYLSKKHASLAPLLTAALKKMKSEGLIERYRIRAQQEVGWPKEWNAKHPLLKNRSAPR